MLVERPKITVSRKRQVHCEVHRLRAANAAMQMALGFSSIHGTENVRCWFTGQHYRSRNMGLIILIILLLLLFGGGGWGYSRYGYGGGIGIGGVLLIVLIVYLLFGYGTI
jgi:hypothetical protein